MGFVLSVVQKQINLF